MYVLVDIAVIFIASVLAIVVSHWLRLPSVVGLLVVGVLLGPEVLGLVDRSEEIEVLAEIGVVLLLFVIGLEFSLPRLRSMRRIVFGLGGAQVVLTIAGVMLAGFIVHRYLSAYFDLALPDYLSDIVNTGIQQGGVKNAVPQAIRQDEMNKVVIFLSAEEKDAVLAAYTLVDKNSPDYEKYLAEYPALETTPVYVLKPLSQVEIDALNPVMARALLPVWGIEQALSDPAKAAEMGKMFGGQDLSKLPPGMDVFTMLEKLPAQQLSQMSAGFSEKFSALGDKMITQAAVGAVRAEYKALGVDTDKLQNNYILKSGAWMLGLTLLSVICTIIVGFLSAKIAAGMARDIRRDVFKTVESYSNTEFDKFSTASLITRTTNDVTQIQMVVIMMVRMVFYAPLIGIGGLIKVLAKDSPLSWLIGLAVLVLISLVLGLSLVAIITRTRMRRTKKW